MSKFNLKPDLAQDQIAIARKLILMQVEENQWIKNRFGEEHHDNWSPASGWNLLDVALDILGWPADNTVETNACERANATGVWPEESFCRDWIWNLYTEMVEQFGAVDVFIEHVRETRKFPEGMGDDIGAMDAYLASIKNPQC